MTTGDRIPPSEAAKEVAESEEARVVGPLSSDRASFLGSIQSKWRQISDSQRISRLQQCQVLHDALTECRLRNHPDRPHDARGRDFRHKNPSPDEIEAESGETSAAETLIETIPAGIRMLHYFQWRNLGEGNDDNNDDHKEEKDVRAEVLRDARRLCSREEHALWACRAVATACGPDLIRVKRCFDDHGPSILKHGAAYERAPANSSRSEEESTKQRGSKATASSPPPCVEVQRALGACVAEGIHSLNQRKEDNIK